MIDLFKKLPRKWKIGSYTFKIQVVPTADPRLEDNDGLTVFPEETIYFNENMTPMRATIVILHEAIHVINWVFGITDESTEEMFTAQVSTGIVSFWQDNPKVMQWLNRTRLVDNLVTGA